MFTIHKRIYKMGKTALITGITGQDGLYLAELLLKKGYEVYGLYRPSSTFKNISHIIDKIKLIEGDLTDQDALNRAIEISKPDEVYNLAAIVGTSSAQSILTGEVNGIGVARILEAIRNKNKDIKFFQASSSDMFGEVQETPQNENTKFCPKTPYAVAKLYGHWITIYYRKRYNMFAVSGILFNHESPIRRIEFVTRKITYGVAKIYLKMCNELLLGNLGAKRDWGFAGDYVEAMWLMLQQDEPDDYVIATGELHSIKEFVEEAFNCVGLDWKKYVKQDSALIRPKEVSNIVGDSTKIREKLNWKPKICFKELVKMMVEHDIKQLKQQLKNKENKK